MRRYISATKMAEFQITITFRLYPASVVSPLTGYWDVKIPMPRINFVQGCTKLEKGQQKKQKPPETLKILHFVTGVS